MPSDWLLEHRRLYDERGQLRNPDPPKPPHPTTRPRLGVVRVSRRFHELVAALEQAMSDFSCAVEREEWAKAQGHYDRVVLARDCLYPYVSQLEQQARVKREVAVRV